MSSRRGPARLKRSMSADAAAGGAGAAAATGAAALPDNCWQTIFSHFTENRDFFGCALVCR